jgi:hypothetical protein
MAVIDGHVEEGIEGIALIVVVDLLANVRPFRRFSQ